ncbi:Alpha carbonic anhydrase 4-like protein 1 [Colletotrichum chlorophyti]|uniref:Alpha carbonic anhydrase 4-like protein 1 n=1 Tax=Colletotrichum chlorophyti TaxID=708187 RepID=A0A1Q8RR82_9PEZI|nr:Alpha carbonic anhydrase 4-like protein 1 [Colletotrichum chlorophyti]
MSVRSVLGALLLASYAMACASHENYHVMNTWKRQVKPAPSTADWAYEASFNWGRVNPNYTLCQTGTQQSPIALSLDNGLALNHMIKFNYPSKTVGNFYNWNYGPAFTPTHEEGVWTKNPSFTYDDTTLYLKGWHIHSPADHTVNGQRSKAELHLVHVDDKGLEKSVLAIRLEPGNANNTFFDQLPRMIGFNEPGVQQQIEIDHLPALNSVLLFNEFWTYQGSMTSPPCTEGIRWFVARQVMFTGVEQMRSILGASTYSARAEQEVWQHRINE